MKPEELVILFGSRNPWPLDKGDYIILKLALFVFKFTIFLNLGFVILLIFLFF
ncbi:MAG: hypothetical protein IJ683_01090 [Butyrivibrio sp.]|nr:hypothetical protein [Butyrivibrio sp.]MBR1640915.1 hypothetical protein [Butyrivibrio sp.]